MRNSWGSGIKKRNGLANRKRRTKPKIFNWSAVSIMGKEKVTPLLPPNGIIPMYILHSNKVIDKW